MKQLALLICLMLAYGLCATTWVVKQDGSGHFIQIQAAINASAHTDSIKVYPGTYIENIDYSGKNIFIYSLEYTSGNPAYRDSTIIDGNRNGSVVKSTSPTSNCGIYGFTIQNGSGEVDLISLGESYKRGGGIFIRDASSFMIEACIIQKNISNDGGGLFIKYAIIDLKSTVIKDNFASLGGGVYIGGMGRVYFDQENRSSVYNNIAGHGQDILAMETRLDLEIYLDTGTVGYYNSYYINYSKSIPFYAGNLLTVSIVRGYLSEINADIYVSPEGSNLNDGLSPSAALKSIYKAFQIIESDSLNPKTIYLAHGDYSSDDGQFYPIGLKSHVSLQGAGVGFTILNNIQYSHTLIGQYIKNSIVSGISVQQSNNPNNTYPMSLGMVDDGIISEFNMRSFDSSTYGGIFFGSNSEYYSNVILDNVILKNINSVSSSGIRALVVDMDVNRLSIDNCNVTGGELDNPVALFNFSGNKLKMTNSKIINNSISYNNGNTVSIGINGNQATRELKLDNVLIANNQTAGAPPVFIAAFNDNPGIINNCTFANNRGSTFAVQLNGNFVVNNSIFNNSTPAEIKSNGSTSQLQFNNNFIRNYPSSTSFEAYNNVSFNDVVLSGDPGFCSSVANNPLSYRLGDSSICRDMGDANGLELPEYDLAGNPRIYGPAIDLGCYEWNYPVSTEDNLAPQAIQLNAFPNPFTEQLTLQLSLKQRGRLSCEFYNLKGQKVRSLADAHYASGEHLLIWDGCDNSGNKLSSGLYFMRMHLDGKLIATHKMVMVK